jgi:L-iditol 2-dehydrogenase
MAGPHIPAQMRAVVYRGANDLRLETLPVPEISAGELLVQVAVCGVCPTDIKKIRLGRLAPPRVFGHETAGTIVATGAGVEGWRPGDRVALHHHVPCLACHFCRHRSFAQCPQYKRTGITAGFEPAGGGYAEYVRVMDFALPGVVKIPARNSFLEGALLEPVNTVLKGIQRLGLLSGDRALIFGQGPIGLLFTGLLAQTGIAVTAVDLLASRLEKARAWGAVRTAMAGAADGGEGVEEAAYDAVIVATPSDRAVTEGLARVRGGGTVLLFAHTVAGNELGLDLAQICVEEKNLVGSYSSDLTLQEEVAETVFSGRLPVAELVSHRFPLGQTGAAIDLASAPSGETLKIVIENAR